MNEALLLQIAKTAINSNFHDDIKVDKEKLLKENPFLGEEQACFVTLTIDHRLRGCIGSLEAKRSLIDDLISNSIAAAFGDPRFLELTEEEFEKTDIEISILTKPELLEYDSFEDLETKLIPNKHGVILELEGKKATFLPQVWEQLPTFNDFMVHLCQKAGLDPHKLPALPKIHTYEATKIRS